jgi:hypothetical protein
MRHTNRRSRYVARRIPWVAVAIGFLSLFSALSVAQTEAPIGTPPSSAQNAANLPPHIGPNQFDPIECLAYLNKLKPGLINPSTFTYAEQSAIKILCDARAADLKLSFSGPQADKRAYDQRRTLSAEFVKALIESNQFDTPGYGRISISGAIITGDLKLSRIKINNSIRLVDITFGGGLDLSYSSTDHNLEISGSLPKTAGLCLRGFQSTRSVFIHDLQQYDSPSELKSQINCDEKMISSIDLPGARIGGELNISSADVRSINAVGVQVTGQVQIQDSDLADSDNPDLNFQGASAGQLVVRGINMRPQLEQGIEKSSTEGCLGHFVDLNGINVAGYAQFIRKIFVQYR